MIKLAVFDIDGTLAPVKKPMLFSDIEKIRTLREKGVRIALCSGKGTYYEDGFARNIGIDDIILIGEVGSVIQFGLMPAKEEFILPYNENVRDNIKIIRRDLEASLSDELWFEPKKVIISPFPNCKKGFLDVNAYVNSHKNLFCDIDVYEYPDCFDIVPKEINKGIALRCVAEKLGISAEDCVSVGDSQNDYSMFAVTGSSYGINLKEKGLASVNVKSLSEALDDMIDKCIK